MTDSSQLVFLQRILFIFKITQATAGKCQVLRVPLAMWLSEVDICCLACYILDEMRKFRNPDNALVFPEETIATVMSRFIEGCHGLNCLRFAFLGWRAGLKLIILGRPEFLKNPVLRKTIWLFHLFALTEGLP